MGQRHAWCGWVYGGPSHKGGWGGLSPSSFLTSRCAPPTSQVCGAVATPYSVYGYVSCAPATATIAPNSTAQLAEAVSSHARAAAAAGARLKIRATHS
jgi:hypothetical protein